MNIIDKSIEEFEFSVRTMNALKSVGILTIREILDRSDDELLVIPNFGRRSLNEIREVMASIGCGMRGSTRETSRHVDAFISASSYRKLIALSERNNTGLRQMLCKIIEDSLNDAPSYDDMALRLERLERLVADLVSEK